MIDPVRAAPMPAPATERDRLRAASQQFEGVFMAQMFKEMRATVPAEDAAPGEDMYTGLMDDALANIAAGRSSHGIGEALFRQLSARLGAGHEGSNGAGDGNRGR